jgi:hypothetical protein
LPVRPTPMSSPSVNSASQSSETPLSPEEQVALIELQRIKYQMDGDPTAKILPPTELTPETTGGAAQ